RVLAVVSTVLGGLLAGATIDRAIVGYPAWRRLGVVAWAQYSRNADLGNGRFVYPVLAIGAVVLSFIAAFLVRHRARSIQIPLYVATVIAAAGLAVTLVAGPYMLAVGQ